MKKSNSISYSKLWKSGREQMPLSRREFIKLSLMASGALGLSLAGCSIEETAGPLGVVDKWIAALNSEDEESFINLHTENILATSKKRRRPISRKFLYEAYRDSTLNQIEKIISFYQDQSACLMVNATQGSDSLCYVFNIVNGVIDEVYEYDSGKYNLADSQYFSGIEMVPGDEGLGKRLTIMENNFVNDLNSRDFSGTGIGEAAVFFGPTRSEPVFGRKNINQLGADYAETYSNVSNETIKVFGQGNLVCLHLVVQGAPIGSLCFVGEFQEGEIARIFEFSSATRLEG